MSQNLLGTDPAKPNYARPEFIASATDLKLVADEIGGTRAMHAASVAYIRKWKAEDKDNYDLRRRCENFFEGLGRTLSAAVGMIFSKPPQMDWNQSEALMKPQSENIDLQGTALHVFVKRFTESAVRDGFSTILVDHTAPPKNPDGSPRVPTAEEEATLNLRPVWTRYDRAQIINWQTTTIENQVVLSLVVLHETAQEPVGLFGVRTVHQFRELRLINGEATWRLWRLTKDDASAEDAFREVDAGYFTDKKGNVAPRIPLAIAYAGRTDAALQATLPLQGVADANLSHWQLSTDLRFNTLVASFAQPTVIGRLAPDPQTGEPRKLKIGPLVVVHLEENGDFRWTEPTGSGLERLEKLRDEKLQQIGTLGLSFLIPDTRAAETAEAKRIDASAQNATLGTAAQGIEDAVNLALEFHAWYLAIPKANAPVATLNRDFESTAIAADIMTAYVGAVAKAGLPPRIMLEAWQQGGRIAADVDLADLELEMLANAAAKEAEARRQAEARGAPIENAPEPVAA